ncbi:MAG: hypothetical protein WD030_06065 [Pirellulales bacterium]
MSQFDPYVEWLGIRDSVRPPYHYRLLAIELFESDPDVIANAADRQMAFLRTLQTGGRVQESQQLLSEVSAAKTCLLNATRKEQYDAWLREQLRGRQEAPAAARPAVRGAAAASAPTEEAFAFVTDDAKRSAPLASQQRRKKKSPAVPLALAGGGLVFVVAVLLVIMNMGGAPDPPRPAGDNRVAASEPRRQPAESEPPEQEPQREPQPPAANPTPQPVDPPANKVAWENAPTEMARNAIDSFNQSREYRMSHETFELLNRARTELGQRKLKEAAATLAEAKLVIQTDDDQAEVARFEALLQLLSEFWQEAETHLATMQPDDELQFAAARAKLVSIDERQFVLADGSAQQSFVREFEQLPANVAVALVAAGPLQVRDQLRIAAFWAVDRAGDLGRAQFSANDAREQGLDADPVLREIAFDPSLVSVVGGPRVAVGEPGPGGFADSTYLAKDPPVERLAAPSGDELNAALAELKTSLEAQYAIAETPAGRTHLIRTLLGRLDQQLSPAARYAMLFEIQKLAIAGGDAAAFLDATGQMAARFDIDKGRFLAAGMARIGETLPDDAHRQVYCEQGLPVVDELMEADAYEAAESLLRNLANVARQVGSISADQRKAITDKRKQVVEAKTLYERFAQAQQKLAAEPDDPAANHVVGTYLAWRKGDWPRGLPHLAKSSNPQVKTAATIELSAPRTAVEQSSLADLWWEIAEVQPEGEPAALAVREHAARWYQSALPGLAGDEAAQASARVEAARKIADEIESGPEMYRALIDDDMVGFNMTRPWSVGQSSGFEKRIRYRLPGNGQYQALWVFENVPRGKYRILATWPTGSRLPEPRGSNVVYVLKDGRRQVGTETVSQALPPQKDAEIKGHAFQQLGVVEVKSGEFRLLLTDVANGFVIADAVAIVQVE